MDFSSVNGKVAIVTGAGSGIGEAVAKIFGENRMKVVCADINIEQGQAVADKICANGGDAIFVQTDCSENSQVRNLIDRTVEHYGKLDGIVNNAGIGQGGRPLHEYEMEEYDKIFELNSKGVFAGMKYAQKQSLNPTVRVDFYSMWHPLQVLSHSEDRLFIQQQSMELLA